MVVRVGASRSAMRTSSVPQPSTFLSGGTDRSTTITAGNTAQVLAPANPYRRSLKVQNFSAGDLWINEVGGTAAIDTPGSTKVLVGSTFTISTNRAISIIGATTGQKFTAVEV